MRKWRSNSTFMRSDLFSRGFLLILRSFPFNHYTFSTNMGWYKRSVITYLTCSCLHFVRLVSQGFSLFETVPERTLPVYFSFVTYRSFSDKKHSIQDWRKKVKCSCGQRFICDNETENPSVMHIYIILQ